MVRMFGILVLAAGCGGAGAKARPKQVYACSDLHYPDYVVESCERDAYPPEQIGCLVEQLRDRNETELTACMPYAPDSGPAERPVHPDGPAPIVDFCQALDAAVGAARADEFASVTGAAQTDQGDGDTAVLSTTLTMSPFRCAIESSNTHAHVFLYCESERWATQTDVEYWLDEYAQHLEDCIPSSWNIAPAKSEDTYGFIYMLDVEAHDALAIVLTATRFSDGTFGLQLQVDPHQE